MTRPTAANGTFPYPHRTVAEVDAATGEMSAQIGFLDNLSRRRALTLAESSRLERLMRAAA